MTVFWLVAATFVVGALLMLLPPLWRTPPRTAQASSAGVNLAVYRDQIEELERDRAVGLLAPEGAEQARREIQHRVAEETLGAVPLPAPQRAARGAAWALGLLIPLGSVSTYLWLGEPQRAAPAQMPAAVAAGDSARHSVTPEQIEKMVTALAERLQRDGNDAEGWTMLGRSYTALGRYRDAAAALRRANELLPGNPALLADYADVLGMAQNKRLAGEPARLVQQALDIDPRHVKSLALAGSVAFEARDYVAARGYWERLVAVVPPDSELARSVQGSIAQARQLEAAGADVAAKGAAAVSADGPTVATAAPPPALTGRVSISPALLAKVQPGDTLFVFARAAQGPRMPLAIVRRPVGAWPSAFSLDDTMAMAPSLKLSGVAQVVIGARISRSGNATPQPGDLIGQSGPVAPGAADVQVLIGQQL